MKRQGYTEEVLLAQIKKYESVLLWSNERLINWIDNILRGFGSAAECPVCWYRWKGGVRCRGRGIKPCLALVDNIKCTHQNWFKIVRIGTLHDIKKAKKALKTRLKYWQKIYVTKYPKAKTWWTK